MSNKGLVQVAAAEQAEEEAAVEELCGPMGFDATDTLSVASNFHHPGHGRDFDDVMDDVRSKDRTLVPSWARS